MEDLDGSVDNDIPGVIIIRQKHQIESGMVVFIEEKSTSGTALHTTSVSLYRQICPYLEDLCLCQCHSQISTITGLVRELICSSGFPSRANRPTLRRLMSVSMLFPKHYMADVWVNGIPHFEIKCVSVLLCVAALHVYLSVFRRLLSLSMFSNCKIGVLVNVIPICTDCTDKFASSVHCTSLCCLQKRWQNLTIVTVRTENGLTVCLNW